MQGFEYSILANRGVLDASEQPEKDDGEHIATRVRDLVQLTHKLKQEPNLGVLGDSVSRFENLIQQGRLRSPHEVELVLVHSCKVRNRFRLFVGEN